MKVGPKYKIGKRLGASVFEKCQTQKFALSEARSKKKRGNRPRAISDFGKQLLEKQKLRYTYGVTEKQLSRYVSEATLSTTDPTNRLFQALESRLDNVVYRLGIAQTRRFARQIVSHGHIMVNGHRVTIASYKTKAGEVIMVRPQSKEKGMFLGFAERIVNQTIPQWLAFDEKALEGKIISLPEFAGADASLDLKLVLEFYSR